MQFSLSHSWRRQRQRVYNFLPIEKKIKCKPMPPIWLCLWGFNYKRGGGCGGWWGRRVGGDCWEGWEVGEWIKATENDLII